MGCGEMDHGGVALVGLFVACGDAAEVFEAAEEVLDEMTPFVHVEIARNPARPVAFRWDDGTGTAPVEFGPDPVGIEGLVAEQSIEIDAFDQGSDPDSVVALAGQENEAHQVSERIDQGDDLGGQAAARSSDGLISSPPFAPVPC
jgi:hypothetical protein